MSAKAQQRPKSRKVAPSVEEEMYRTFVASDAQLTTKQIEAMEANISSFDMTRRIALATLTRSGRQLANSVKDQKSAQALAQALASLDAYRHNLGKLTELLDSASARLLLALCGNERAYKAMIAARDAVKRAGTEDFTQIAS